MTDQEPDVASWLARGSSLAFAYLTTTGRETGRPHRIEIWFAVHEGRTYLMSGGRDRSDWVRNIRADGHVTFDLGGESREGIARIIGPDTAEDALARDLLVRKYATSREPLVDWKRRSLPVVVEFDGVDASRTISEGASR
jgi:deazaflavin-dependent oxidoreductase (nitroreductase family)